MCAIAQSQAKLLQGYREDDGLYLESDTDDQLLIHIAFSQGRTLPFQAFTSVDLGFLGN